MVTAFDLLGDNKLSIDVISRKVTIPESARTLGVESDEDVQRLEFTMPRFYNDIDLSAFNIRINYKNALGGEDVGAISDKNVTADAITFSWVVGRFAFVKQGAVEFSICCRKIAADGTVDKEFNTTPATVEVLKGLETGESADIVEKDAITVAVIEALEKAKQDGDFKPVKGVDYFDDADKNELVNDLAVEAAGIFANAYKNTVEGAVARMVDVSPITHPIKVHIHGPNLLRLEANENIDGADFNYYWQCTYSVDNGIGRVYLTNTATHGVAYARVGSVILKKGRTYQCITDDAQNIGLMLGWRHSTSSTIWNLTTSTFTPTEDVIIDVALYMHDISTVGNTAAINITICEYGATDVPLAFGDITTVPVIVCGKNILPKPYYDSDGYTTGGITYEVRSDGGIKARGTATANSYFRLMNTDLTNIPCTLSNCIYDSDNKFTYIQVSKGQTVDKVFYPQVELGDVATEWASPVPRVTYTPDEDGNVTVDSVSPEMSIFTGAADITVEAEYNRDVNAFMGDIDDALSAIISIQESLIGGTDA